MTQPLLRGFVYIVPGYNRHLLLSLPCIVGGCKSPAVEKVRTTNGRVVVDVCESCAKSLRAMGWL